MWYHGTSKLNKHNILANGFRLDYGRFGDAVYFTNNKEEAQGFGEELITVKIEDSKIKYFNYKDLKEIFPYVSIDEEEGITELRRYVTEKLGYDTVAIAYDDGCVELCVYNTKMIKIIQ